MTIHNEETAEKIAVGLSEVMVKQAIDGERKFYQRIGTAVVDSITPELTVTVEGEKEPSTFMYDEVVSRQVGHHTYIRPKAGVPMHKPLTPFHPAAIAAPVKVIDAKPKKKRTTKKS